jgi:hypothetical protein
MMNSYPLDEVTVGQEVLIMCFNYFYHGVLANFNEKWITLADPKIVYKTGEWGKGKFEDEQSLGVKFWHINRDAIESLGAINASNEV